MEKRIGEGGFLRERDKTQIFNGYGDQVARCTPAWT